jgi:hypothetical protein
MAALEVRAPLDGIVVLQRDWKGDTPQIGKTVWSGYPLAKPRIRGIPVQYFAATLDLGKQDPDTMKPGQRVVAVLDLGEEKSVLSVPRQAVFEKDGRKVVYRKAGRGFAPVEVTLGASAFGRVISTTGLAEGDVIALSDPEEKPKKPEGGSGAAPVAGGMS